MSDEQQQLPGLEAQDDEQPVKKQRGGAREGAGRKPRALLNATRVIRVPDDYVPIIRALIQHLDDTRRIGSKDLDCTSPQYIHLGGLRPHFIQFITSGKIRPGTEPVPLEHEWRKPKQKKET